jgi:D-alanyl-D-alanine carboxypeptidase
MINKKSDINLIKFVENIYHNIVHYSIKRYNWIILYFSFFIIHFSLVFNTCIAQEESNLQKSNQNIENVQTILSDTVKSLDGLKNSINKVLNSIVMKSAKMSVSVYSLDKKQFYYTRNADLPLVPASNTKLVTTFLALENLTKDYKFKTQIYTDADSSNESKSVDEFNLNGNLYIVGGGDALLRISDIEYLADKLKSRGIKKINGDIYADGSFFDGMKSRLEYSGDRDVVEPLPPISALSLERNTATVIVHTSGLPGSAAKAQVIPASDAFRIINTSKINVPKLKAQKTKISDKKSIKSTKTKYTKKSYIKKSRKSRHSHSFLDFHSIPDIYEVNNIYDQKYGDRIKSNKNVRQAVPSIKIQSKLSSDGFQDFFIGGSVPRNQSFTRSFTLFNPELAVAGFLKNRLYSGNISVTGKLRVGSIDKTSKKAGLLAEVTRPISDMIYLINKNSDNYLAETLFKTVGASQGNTSSNCEENRKLFSHLFDSLSIPCENCIINDGSGLSRRNRLTANTLVKLLEISTNRSYGRFLDSSLSIAGVDGTLRKRMKGTKAQNNLRAKTGTHNNVSALSGFVTTLDGERLAFSFIFNGPNVGLYKRAENDLGVLLSNFTNK